MIQDFKVAHMIPVIKKKITPEEFIKEQKEKLNQWYINKMGLWTRIISIEEDKACIINSTIKVETSDTLQFTPVHSQAYSGLIKNVENIRRLMI